MRLLLDTNAFYWFRTSPEKIPRPTLLAILDEENEKLLSIISAWELAIKAAKGGIQIPSPGLQAFVTTALQAGMSLLDVRLDHIARLQQLSLGEHRDPFDRVLVAQALVENLTLITSDSQLQQYGVPIQWK